MQNALKGTDQSHWTVRVPGARVTHLWTDNPAEAAPVAAPDRRDARFKDPAWSEGVFDYMKQAYLITSNWTEQLVGNRIFRPEQVSTGKTGVKYVPLEQRP